MTAGFFTGEVTRLFMIRIMRRPATYCISPRPVTREVVPFPTPRPVPRANGAYA